MLLRIPVLVVAVALMSAFACYAMAEGVGRYDSVIEIDATDGVSEEELRLYHEIPRTKLVYRRLVKITVDPRRGVFDLGALVIDTRNRARIFTQTIVVRFKPKLRLRSEMVFNDVVLDSRTVKKINLEIRMAYAT